MTEIFNLLVQIVQFCWKWVYWFSPYKLLIVSQGELGVRMTFGKPGPSLPPGVHSATTFQTFEVAQARLCKIHIDDIEFVFNDRVPVIIGAVATYNIDNLGSWLCNSEHSEWLLSEVVEAEIRAELSETTFDDYYNDIKNMEASVKSAAQQQIDRFCLGAQLAYVRFNRITVSDDTASRALCIDRLVQALERIPEDLRRDPSFGAMVALVSGAQPVNNIGSVEEASYGEE